MSFADDMRELASDLTEEFSEDIGKSIFKHLVIDIYDTDQGKVSKEYEEYPVNAVYEKIKASGVIDAAYISEHTQCTIAGSEIDVVPSVKDLIVFPDGTTHKIISRDFDQFKAAFILHVEKKNVRS